MVGDEALQYLKNKSESRDLASYKIWSFLTVCQALCATAPLRENFS
jgi:hypothetical protein